MTLTTRSYTLAKYIWVKFSVKSFILLNFVMDLHVEVYVNYAALIQSYPVSATLFCWLDSYRLYKKFWKAPWKHQGITIPLLNQYCIQYRKKQVGLVTFWIPVWLILYLYCFLLNKYKYFIDNHSALRGQDNHILIINMQFIIIVTNRCTGECGQREATSTHS